MRKIVEVFCFVFQELPTVDIKSSNWKGTLISILVILLLCSIITFAIYIINPDIHSKWP